MRHVCRECGSTSDTAGRCADDDVPREPVNGDALLGTEIARHRLTRVLGVGGMGSVYLGVHEALRSRVAIKILSADYARQPAFVMRFFAEARAVNVIRHENIASIRDLDHLPTGQPFIVMEYVEGRTLRELRPVPPMTDAVYIIAEVLLGLAASHDVGIVHRDLKPDNVMVTPKGSVKVLDFGIAKLLQEPGLTATGIVLGTPQYMAPEMVVGQPVDARADLYAVGVLLFELLTGELPFAGTTTYEVMRAHVDVPPRRLRALRPELPEALELVITRALEKRPADRFRSAREMETALRAVVNPRARWSRPGTIPPAMASPAPIASGPDTLPLEADPMTLHRIVRDLIEHATDAQPSTRSLHDRLAANARAISIAGPQRAHPSWARIAHGPDDEFLELADDLAVQLWAAGPGVYAEVHGPGVLADLEAFLGPLVAGQPIATGEIVRVDRELGERRLRVFIEHQKGSIVRVTLHFEM